MNRASLRIAPPSALPNLPSLCLPPRMVTRPVIFISSVSRDLASARQLVANTLSFLGCEPEWEDNFPTEQGELRAMLRRRMKACQGVIQFVGHSYGAEPPVVDGQFGRVSYTQYEALHARQRGKKVWYLVLDGSFPTDPHDPEPAELRALQGAYRERVQADQHLYHPIASHDALEANVLKFRDELTALRRRGKQWAFTVAAMLLLLVGLGVWQMKSGSEVSEKLTKLEGEMAKLREAVSLFAPVQARVLREEPGTKPDQIEDKVYEALAAQLGVDPKRLRTELPALARKLQEAPGTPLFERANAAYVAKDFAEAERLALLAADEAQRAAPPRTQDAIRAWELAGQAAQERIHYRDALAHLRTCVPRRSSRTASATPPSGHGSSSPSRASSTTTATTGVPVQSASRW